ncbi:Down syndrome cell adhesion molecule-like protein [Operophtera brumata]|uniref:Down syndrome cell adhesion molecule-like protein n=1 Tax=Operophtera brumata TaxID=104452 RepID=A0A0L7LAR6_OPEBR|nr:Down syndrome cell adhesion molecule-like protein [Operophtera brumata]
MFVRHVINEDDRSEYSAAPPGRSEGGEGQEHGPVFLMEPPARLVFGNSTGARAACAAHGSPAPVLAWQLPDGAPLDDVPGLR